MKSVLRRTWHYLTGARLANHGSRSTIDCKFALRIFLALTRGGAAW